MRVFEVINDENRIVSIDLFRGIAIIAVVLFHFGYLEFGFLGVDLFFVISGFLVSRPLLKAFHDNKKLQIKNFIVSRGFKIWPSYYFFLLVGTLLAILLIKPFNPSQIIPWNIFPRYLFFFRNYSPPPEIWTFDHVWSLCVEEHFYILLPLGFFILRTWRKEKLLLMMILLVIIASEASKIIGYLTKFAEYPTYTHNRIDAMALGVLISYIRLFYPNHFNNKRYKIISLTIGILLFISLFVLKPYLSPNFFVQVIQHTIAPLSFACLIFALYAIKSNLVFIKIIRFLSYYSYNWYLWHPIVATIFLHYFTKNVVSLLGYMIVSLILAILCTVFIEEKALNYRSKFLTKTPD